MFGIPTDDKVSAVLVYRSHLRVGIGIAVVCESSRGKNVAVGSDNRVERLGSCNVVARADGISQNSRAVGEHCGVKGVYRTGTAVICNLYGRPLGTVVDAIIDVVFHVESGGNIVACRHRGCVHTAPSNDSPIPVACHHGRHIRHKVVGKPRSRPRRAVINSGVNFGCVEHHAKVVVCNVGVNIHFRHFDLLYPRGKSVVLGTACNYVKVGEDIAFGRVDAPHIIVSVTVLYGIAYDGFGVLCVVIIGNIQEHLAVIGEHRVSIRIGVRLNVGQ